jgi:transposase-like protein
MKHYSEEYKKKALELVLNNNRRIRMTARQLGISANTLKCWVKQYDWDVLDGPVPSGLTPDEECLLLRKKVARLEEDNEILKKFRAFLEKQPKSGTAS